VLDKDIDFFDTMALQKYLFALLKWKQIFILVNYDEIAKQNLLDFSLDSELRDLDYNPHHVAGNNYLLHH
jgi:hypothetical protein